MSETPLICLLNSYSSRDIPGVTWVREPLKCGLGLIMRLEMGL